MSHDDEFLGRMMQWEDAILEEALEHKAGPIACGRMIGPYPCCSVVCGDCLELLPQIPDDAVDCVITDPPYPDYEYPWKFIALENLGLHLPGFYFWPAGVEFPLVHNAEHVWSKCNVCIGDAEPYESIYEIGGSGTCLVFRHAVINCEMNAVMNSDEYFRHPTQKPIKLMERLVRRTHGLILDPFCGSGTTLVAAKKLGRHFLGFEISPEYCAIARDRLVRIDAQPTLFEPKPEQLKLLDAL